MNRDRSVLAAFTLALLLLALWMLLVGPLDYREAVTYVDADTMERMERRAVASMRGDGYTEKEIREVMDNLHDRYREKGP